MRYHASAEEMAGALDLPLLLRADVDPRFLERHDRLSGYAAERPHAARLYHRVLSALGSSSLADRVIWVAGPWGSLEHLPWAIGLAGAMADAGLRAFLLTRTLDLPHSGTGGEGEHFGGTLGAKGEVIANAALADFPTDLQGVRVLFPGRGARRDAISPSGLVLADTLPEELEGACRPPAEIDGVVLVAAFRDHGVYELECCARQLRSAGHRVLGMVGLGPEAGAVVESNPDTSAEPGAARSLIGLNARRSQGTEPAPPLPAVESPPVEPKTPAPAARSKPGPLPPAQATPVSAPAPKEDSSLTRARELDRKAAQPSGAEGAGTKHETARGATPPQAEPGQETSPSFSVAPQLAPSGPKPAETPSYAKASAKAKSARTSVPRDTTPLAPETSAAAKPEPKPEPSPKQEPQPKPSPAPPAATPPKDAASAVPLLSRWEAEATRDRRMRVIGATVAVVAMVLLAAGMGIVYGKRKGWIASPAPSAAVETTSGATSGAANPSATGSPVAASSRTDSSATASDVEVAPALGATPTEPPTERRAAGLEEESETAASDRPGDDEPKPTRAFPWGEPKRAVGLVDTSRVGVNATAPRDSADGPSITPDAGSTAAILRADGASDADGGPSSAAPDSGGFVVHLSSFKLEHEARTEVANLAASGIEARYLLVEVPGKGPWYRVVTGRFATFAEAEAKAMRLCRSKGLPRTFVAGRGGRSTPVPVDSLAGVPAESRPRMD